MPVASISVSPSQKSTKLPLRSSANHRQQHTTAVVITAAESSPNSLAARYTLGLYRPSCCSLVVERVSG